jgi:hypothetical protein
MENGRISHRGIPLENVMTAGRVRITDLIDADAGSARYCGHSIGRVIGVEQDGTIRHVRVDRIERSGDRVYGIGPVIGAAQAEKIQTRWDIRWGLRCAPVAPPPKPDSPPSARAVSTRFSDIDGAAAAIVSAGYRELARRCHPDTGGSHETMADAADPGRSKITALRELVRGLTAPCIYAFARSCKRVDRETIPDPDGGTALHLAFARIKSHKITRAVLITDGLPDDETAAIREAAGLALDILYVGPAPKPAFLDRLARAAKPGSRADMATLASASRQALQQTVRLLLTDGSR